MVKRCQEAGSLNRPCSGSRLRGCDLRPRANNCFDSKLFCSIIPIPTTPEKLQIVRNLSTKRGVMIQIFLCSYATLIILKFI